MHGFLRYLFGGQERDPSVPLDTTMRAQKVNDESPDSPHVFKFVIVLLRNVLERSL